jgi:D-alanine--poly(phosphoribitol) ligase subunit 1
VIQEFYSQLLNVFKTSKNDFFRHTEKSYSYVDTYSMMTKINSVFENKKQKKVLVLAPKTFNSYCAIYSTILSSNIWIPVSATLPAERLQTIVDILKPDILLYEGEVPNALESIEAYSLNELATSNESRELDLIEFQSDEIAYIMFTSGSTGIPKGVPMTHLNYINFINNALEIIPFEKGEVFSDYHEFSFDISIFYLFCAPMTESSISPILTMEEKMFPMVHAQKNEVTVWSSVPSMISSLIKLRPDTAQETKIKVLFFCGEPFSLKTLEYCIKNLSIPNIYNFYGLTETGVENFYYHIDQKTDLSKFSEFGFLPIGSPLKGNEVSITDEKELLLSGVQVTPGYLGEIGKEKFEVINDKLWYHTGDLVEEHDNLYFCKGRIDSQVKIGGFRIELMDIEVNVSKLSGIKNSICFVIEKNGQQRLCCAVVKDKGLEIKSSEISKMLKEKLPDYMVPKKYFFLDEIPVNANGKIDRKKIKTMLTE